MLERMGKGFTQADIAKASACYHKAGIATSFQLLLGGPGETRETAQEMAQGKGLIGISMPTKSSTRWISDGESMVKEFTALGYETDLPKHWPGVRMNWQGST